MPDFYPLSDQHKQRYSKARMARDVRFDGVFFIAVKTTGIYCRPICPAKSPLEKNIEYYPSAVLAADAGFRPCLRCRPETAPQSSAWLGTETSFQRALELIDQGALQTQTLTQLADRLGITDRYLRLLFEKYLGIAPKQYAIYQQCLFAKQLLHESDLSITDIAFASGFKSVRRFNEAIQQQLGLTPRQIRKQDKPVKTGIKLKLPYRPPYAWSNLLAFLQVRLIEGLEWADGNSYSRTIRYRDSKGYFTISADLNNHCLNLFVDLDNTRYLNVITQRIKSLFDVNAPIEIIDQHLQTQLKQSIDYLPGLRIPGIWSSFEAGVRAILGQQVSVLAAKKLVTVFVQNLGERIQFNNLPAQYLFPEPDAVVNSDLDFFRMPQARKETLRRLAKHFMNSKEPENIDAWLALKGIGPWTVNYVKIRSSKAPDIWLAGDAGLKNALKNIDDMPDIEKMRPWHSYLTFQLWNQL